VKAISIKQPWAYLIVNGHKDIENRTWTTKHRGPLLVHASKQVDKGAWRRYQQEFNLPPMDKFELGGIVGQVEVVDCVPAHPSRWFQGKYGFVLQNAQKLPFRPYKGQLNLFEVKEELG